MRSSPAAATVTWGRGRLCQAATSSVRVGAGRVPDAVQAATRQGRLVTGARVRAAPTHARLQSLASPAAVRGRRRPDTLVVTVARVAFVPASDPTVHSWVGLGLPTCGTAQISTPAARKGKCARGQGPFTDGTVYNVVDAARSTTSSMRATSCTCLATTRSYLRPGDPDPRDESTALAGCVPRRSRHVGVVWTIDRKPSGCSAQIQGRGAATRICSLTTRTGQAPFVSGSA